MSTEAKNTTHAEKFAEYLESLYEQDDRAALASLRRGLGRPPGEAGEMHRYVVPHVRGMKEWQENAYYIVAALFALHPGRNWRATGDGAKQRTNLGASLGILAQESPSVEHRFVALLNARVEELPHHLRNIISLLKSSQKEIPIDWAQLIENIIRWNQENRRVQRDWSRAFWSLTAEAETGDDAALSATPVEPDSEKMDAE